MGGHGSARGWWTGLVVLVAMVVAAPAGAERLSLRLQAGQLMGLRVGSQNLPAHGVGGFYVRLYSATAGENLLENSDFARLPSPLPERFALDPALPWKGKPSLCIALPADSNTDSGYLDFTTSKVRAGRIYLLRFAHRGERLGGELPPMIHVREYDAVGNLATPQLNMELLSGNYDWKEETIAIPMVEGAVRLDLSLHHPVGTGRFWISEPSLGEVKEEPTMSVPGLWNVDPKGGLVFSGLLPRANTTLVARVVEGEEGISFQAALAAETRDVQAHPLAAIVGFRLPLEAVGWRWGDSLREERTIAPEGVYRDLQMLGLRQLRLASRFPLAAVSGPEHGVALMAPLAPTTYNRFSYDARGFLTIEFDLGLAVRTEGQVQSSTFIFDLAHFDPRWGYRAALARYYARYPQHFASTAKQGGWWLGETSAMHDLQDFGLQYAEQHFANAGDTKLLNQQGLYACSYSEPWMWRIQAKWIQATDIAGTKPLSYYLPRLERDANLPPTERDDGDYFPASRQESVRAFLNSVMTGEDGKYRQNAVRSYGAPSIELSTSALPTIKSAQWGEANRGLLSYRYETLEDQKRTAAGGAKVDGVYFDSVGDWSDISAEDHRVDHFRFASFPLTFSYATGTPVISGVAAMAEYMQFIRGKQYVTMANSDAKYAAYAAPYLDFIGAGENYSPEGMEEGVLSHLRRVAYHRSLSFGNGGLVDVTPEERDRRLRGLLFYDLYPGIFSRDAAAMERARPEFARYVPVLRAMGAAGWEPVPWATASDPAVWVERYGPGKGETVYLALRNTAKTARTVTVTVEPAGFERTGNPTGGVEVLSGRAVALEAARPDLPGGLCRFSLELPPQDTVVVRFVVKP